MKILWTDIIINNAIYNNKGTGKMPSDTSISVHICRRAASGDKRAVFWALFIGVRRRKGSTLKDAFVLVSNKHFNTHPSYISMPAHFCYQLTQYQQVIHSPVCMLTPIHIRYFKSSQHRYRKRGRKAAWYW